ncbi:uncharacterized protein J7T54_004329 [Emericellopsis cladophorae]|uniref:Autophagy-related protein 6 n=1 Tax=Emericellopsis cladophorae TaxID=2686198 RepID=A0A9Q0BEV0_9HYPO|nr:uncharacterized protein J7T54_004329 [Emericellopsis cladophorae]KAI6783302.1 hypothetical protein J7T54_004329 [Emericellopsis cladophorae]
MYCQKCRQPLKLDGSLEDLNPAAYDLLISSSTPQDERPSTNQPSAKPAAQASARKALYDKVSRNNPQPIFTRNHGGSRRDSAMSFIYLTESQVGHSQMPPEPATVPPQLAQADSNRATKDRTPATDMGKIDRLFEILSSRSDIDHPICVDCGDMLVEGFQKRLNTALKERDSYVKHLRHVQANKPSKENIKAQQEATRKALTDKEQATTELRRLEAEKDTLDTEILELEEEARKLDMEEELFWRERNDFAAKMADFQAERDSVNVKYSNDSQLLEKLQRSNIYNDTFCISHDGSFATINGLRLGRLSNKPVDWPEINAAWGHALLLLVTVADKLAYKFQGYEAQPMGSTSRIIRYDVATSSSNRSGNRGTVQPPPKKHALELFSSGDMPLGLTFMHRKFDNAMVAFLELVRQLGIHVEQQTEASGNMLSLPYRIDGDKIADVSIKLGIAQDDGWTKACKLTLTCCKFLLAHAAHTNSSETRASG